MDANIVCLRVRGSGELFVTSTPGPTVLSEILQTVCSMFKAENSILKITDEP